MPKMRRHPLKGLSAALESFMATVTALSENIDFSDVMTGKHVARLLHRSGETVRQLTERKWHPLPFINTGMGRKKQRLFRRASVLRWLEEEEQGSDPIPVKAIPSRRRRTKPVRSGQRLAS
jgi:hypothetical protein